MMSNYVDRIGGNTWPGWKPLPSCTPEVLGPHMAEFVSREFGRKFTSNYRFACDLWTGF